MAKTLHLNYLENGRVYNENRVYAYDNENLGTNLTVDVPEFYEDFTFIMDCKNGTVTKQIELGTGHTSYNLSLDDSLTVAGTLELQLWATILSLDETVKVQWEKYNLTINDALNISTITAESNPDIIATHTAQIADLYNITSILYELGDGNKFLADDGSYKYVTSVIDYNDLSDKPQINSVTLTGNKTSSDLGLQEAGDYLTEEVDPTVPSWAKSPTKPTYEYSEIENTPDIPTKVSELENDSGYITTYVETDPTVPSWAKQSTKPTYSYSEVGAEPANSNIQSHISDSNIHLTSTEKTNVGKLISTGDGTKYLGNDGNYTTVSSGTMDYDDLDNKPSINSVELTGDKSLNDLGIQPAGSYLTEEVDPTVPSWAKAETKPAYTLDELSDVNVGTPTVGDLLEYGGSEWTKGTKDVYKTYAGFVNRTDSTIAVDGSGVVTLAPAVTSFTVYTMGSKHILTNTQTVTVTADQTITYIYLDSSGVLQKSITAWDITSGTNIPVAICFKDGSTYALTDERHGHERNKAWHNWAHNNIGAVYKSGLTGTFTTSTLSVTQGIIYDEDIQADTGSARTTCSLWHRNATTGMRLTRGSNYAKAVSVGGILQYDNGSGTLQDVTNNRYATNWVYATNDPTEPIYCVIGQGDYTSLPNARNALAPTINLSTAEWKLIYRVIYQRTAGVPAGTFIESADFRTVQTGVATSASTTDHNALINRDATNSHPASAISYDNGGDVLTNVQAELDARLNKTYTLDILTSDWSTNSFTQSVTGLVDADFVTIQAPDSYYLDYGLSYTQSGNSITFSVTVTPLVTLSLGIAVVKAVSGGAL